MEWVGEGGAGWDRIALRRWRREEGLGIQSGREGGRRRGARRMRVLFLMPVYGYLSLSRSRINLLGREAGMEKTQLSVLSALPSKDK